MTFRIEEWVPSTNEWMIVRRNIPEAERAGLLEANLADGNVYSNTDPTEPAPAGKVVFRFVPA